MADKTNVIFKYGLEENVNTALSPGTIYFSVLKKIDEDTDAFKEYVGKIYYDYDDGDGVIQKVDMTRLAHTILINGKTFDDTSDLDVGILGTLYGGTGNHSYARARMLYVNGNPDADDELWFSTANNIYTNGSLMAIGVLGLDDNDIAKKISNNAFTVISGLANFKDGVVADSITTDDLNASSQIVVKGEESWYSEDENAALVVQGGASIQKLLSACSIRVDSNNGENLGCNLYYDADGEYLEFNFTEGRYIEAV